MVNRENKMQSYHRLTKKVRHLQELTKKLLKMGYSDKAIKEILKWYMER